ncbi:MAG: PSD1 and planctomycete cytochrome C domain-containing protein [Bryobacter sp.]|nr:PSD1 and planctomycete cytochrome C domain-containing protein [Bryobacter sp.]
MRSWLFVGALVCVPGWAVDFAKDVQAVFARKCVMCHGGAQQISGLRLDNGADAAKGGYSGAVIQPGQAAASKLLERVKSTKDGFRMPPMGPPLKAEEVAALEAWINEGAVWPAGLTIGKATTRKSTHWAFQPLWQGSAPEVSKSDWVRNGIDRFVLAKLEANKLAPSPEADKATLLRRVALDLTGLPPDTALLQAYLADKSANAYERAVDQLLASTHYGERWARFWLDLARYADSDGYEKDLTRPYAWRWRNYVIDSFNADKPFDQFTIEQLAGDLLPNPTLEQKIATGFHRNSLINREAGVHRDEDRFETLVNRVNTTSTTWLGLTMGCAQCHDHKYDPISQKEYYQTMAVFSASRDEVIDAPMPGELGVWLRTKKTYETQRAELWRSAPLEEWFNTWQTKMRAAVREPGKDLEWDFSVTSFRVMFDHAEEVLLQEANARSDRDHWRLKRYFVNSPGQLFKDDKENGDKLKAIKEAWNKLDAATPFLTQAYVIQPQPNAKPQHIAVRGDWREKGIPVEAGALGVLPKFAPQAEDPRLAYARWLVSEENFLTPRVIVNRFWQEFFGRGLVKTSEDFGTQGDKPSHPELLDWLARGFRAKGWSVKQLHKLIVTSATYRQSSQHRADAAAIDADNALLSRQLRKRLTAEGIRDSALAVSGLLNTTVGGPSVKPPQPKGVAELVYANSAKWVDAEGPERYRRGLYIHFQRTAPYPMLVNFDAPDMSVACSRRRSSNTPLQALNLLNDPVFVEAANALAYRLEAEAPGAQDARLDYAYQLVLGRTPTAKEKARLLQLLDSQSNSAQSSSAQNSNAWFLVARVLLNTDEFIVRE